MTSNSHPSQLIIYQTEDGQTRIDARFEGETVWLTQKLMAELFDVGIPTINEHLKNIFETGELDENSVSIPSVPRISVPRLLLKCISGVR